MGNAWAQAGEASGPPPLYNIVPFVLMLAIFYFILLRPEQKRRRQHDQLLAGLKRNDQVVLSCGLHGRVVALGEKVVTVEIAPKVQVQFDRAAVQNVAGLDGEGKDKEREKP